MLKKMTAGESMQATNQIEVTAPSQLLQRAVQPVTGRPLGVDAEALFLLAYTKPQGGGTPAETPDTSVSKPEGGAADQPHTEFTEIAAVDLQVAPQEKRQLVVRASVEAPSDLPDPVNDVEKIDRSKLHLDIGFPLSEASSSVPGEPDIRTVPVSEPLVPLVVSPNFPSADGAVKVQSIQEILVPIQHRVDVPVGPPNVTSKMPKPRGAEIMMPLSALPVVARENGAGPIASAVVLEPVSNPGLADKIPTEANAEPTDKLVIKQNAIVEPNPRPSAPSPERVPVAGQQAADILPTPQKPDLARVEIRNSPIPTEELVATPTRIDVEYLQASEGMSKPNGSQSRAGFDPAPKQQVAPQPQDLPASEIKVSQIVAKSDVAHTEIFKKAHPPAPDGSFPHAGDGVAPRENRNATVATPLAGPTELVEGVAPVEVEAALTGEASLNEPRGSLPTERPRIGVQNGSIPQANIRSLAVEIGSKMDGVSAQTVELMVEPKELGRVRFAMLPGELNVSLIVTAERPETLEIIRRHAGALETEFRKEGFENISFQFSQNRHDGNDDFEAAEHAEDAVMDDMQGTDGSPQTQTGPKSNLGSETLDIRI